MDKYWYPIDPISLSANFAAVSLDLESPQNHLIENIVILNAINKNISKVLEDYGNETVKFHRLEKSMEEFVSTFHRVIMTYQRDGEPQKKFPPIRR